MSRNFNMLTTLTTLSICYRRLAEVTAAAIVVVLTGCHSLSTGNRSLVDNDTVATQNDALALGLRGDQLRDRPTFPDYVGAHDAYRQALRLEPRNVYLLVARATAYVREAKDDYVQSKPWLLAPFGNEAAARRARKNFARALAASADALKVNPNNFGAHFVIAEVHAMREDFRSASEKLDEIERLGLIPPRQAAAFYGWRGYVRKQMFRTAESNSDFNAAIESSRPLAFAEYADAQLSMPGANSVVFDPVIGEPPPMVPPPRPLPVQAGPAITAMAPMARALETKGERMRAAPAAEDTIGATSGGDGHLTAPSPMATPAKARSAATRPSSRRGADAGLKVGAVVYGLSVAGSAVGLGAAVAVALSQGLQERDAFSALIAGAGLGATVGAVGGAYIGTGAVGADELGDEVALWSAGLAGVSGIAGFVMMSQAKNENDGLISASVSGLGPMAAAIGAGVVTAGPGE